MYYENLAISNCLLQFFDSYKGKNEETTKASIGLIWNLRISKLEATKNYIDIVEIVIFATWTQWHHSFFLNPNLIEQ